MGDFCFEANLRNIKTDSDLIRNLAIHLQESALVVFKSRVDLNLDTLNFDEVVQFLRQAFPPTNRLNDIEKFERLILTTEKDIEFVFHASKLYSLAYPIGQNNPNLVPSLVRKLRPDLRNYVDKKGADNFAELIEIIHKFREIESEKFSSQNSVDKIKFLNSRKL